MLSLTLTKQTKITNTVYLTAQTVLNYNINEMKTKHSMGRFENYDIRRMIKIGF